MTGGKLDPSPNACLASEGNRRRVRSGTHSSRRSHYVYPLGPSAASLLPPPSPRPGGPAAGPEARGAPPGGTALTWLAASSAGRQQGAAHTQSRGHQQQLPRPHCPEAGAHRAALLRETVSASGRLGSALCLLPPGPAARRSPSERSPPGGRRRRLSAARRSVSVSGGTMSARVAEGRSAGAGQRRQGRAPPGVERAPRRGRRTPLPAGPSAAA